MKKERKNSLLNTRLDYDHAIDAYYSHSGSLSSTLRQLAFAEGAANWMIITFLSKNTPQCVAILSSLIFIFLFLFFVSDVFQYLFLYMNYKEICENMESNAHYTISKKESESFCGNFCFISKLVFSFLAGVVFIIYGLIGLFHIYQ